MLCPGPRRWLLLLLGLYPQVNHSLHTPGQAGGAAAIAGGASGPAPSPELGWIWAGCIVALSPKTHTSDSVGDDPRALPSEVRRLGVFCFGHPIM